MPPLIIAHRGSSIQEPENTLRAFDTAIRQGADMIELDLHITIDNHVVVCHDPFGSQTLSEIKQLDVGKGERIPTLDETLDLVLGKSKLYLEIKDPRAATKTISIIRSRKCEFEVMIASFDLNLMRMLGNEINDIELGVIVEGVIPWSELSNINFQVLCLSLELCSFESVKQIKAQNKKLYAWTVDAPDDFNRLIDLDVEGIVTNVPGQLFNTLY